MGLFLTTSQLEELTDTRRRTLQMAWLDKHGWEYEVSRLGNPKVLVAYMEKRMGLASQEQQATTEPDFTQWEPRPA